MSLFSKGSGNPGEIEIADSVVTWMFAPAHQLLDSFCDVLIPRQIPLMKRGHYGVYNPRRDWSKLSPQQHQHDDLILLIELLPEFAFIQRHNVPQFASDELTRGLVKMVETKRIPIWLAFATTLLLDIHHILRDKADTAFQELQDIGNKAALSLRRYIEFSEHIPSPSTWSKSDAKQIDRLAEHIEQCILDDMIFPFKDKEYKKKMQAYSESQERFYLYKRQPVLCGILAFRTILETQYTGVTLCNVRFCPRVNPV